VKRPSRKNTPVSFFPPPPSPDEPLQQQHRQPGWFGPPDNVLGVGLPFRVVLARDERTVVAITGCTAYPNGAIFEIALRVRPGSLSVDEQRALMHSNPFHPHAPFVPGERPPELFRIGVVLADGRKATSLDDRRAIFGQEEPPADPVLLMRGGGGGHISWSASFWLWPLPPAGPLAFVVEWPLLGLPETRIETDGAEIAEAGASAEVLWPDESSGGSGLWVAGVS
jgi:hypothetical protein